MITVVMTGERRPGTECGLLNRKKSGVATLIDYGLQSFCASMEVFQYPPESLQSPLTRWNYFLPKRLDIKSLHGIRAQVTDSPPHSILRSVAFVCATM